MAKLIQITPRLFQLSLGPVNAFLIDDKGLTLIDTGYKNSIRKIFRAVSKANLDPFQIKQIILTHCHPDHAGSAAAIKRKLNIPVFAHSADAPLIRTGISGRFPYERTPGAFNWMVYNLYIRRAGKTNEPVEIEEELTDNDVLPIGGGLQVIHTPGHSAGHIALLLKEEGVCITGDLCANNNGISLSTVYECTPLGIKSILKASALSFDRAVFGHGKPLFQDADKIIRKHFNH